MSHVRNLFHGSSSQARPLASVPIRVLPEHTTPVAHARTEDPVTKASTLREFPTEQARIRPENRLAFYSDPRGPAADRFRLLRMRLRELWNAGKLKKLLVTSPMAHDGKTTVVLNLATALSERGKRSVLVMEADLHHSYIAENLGLRSSAGVAECLHDDLDPFCVIRRIEPLGWCFLGAGEPRRNPTELLQTPAFGKLMQQLAPEFDWILIDSPPTVPLTDAISLQQHADGTLMVVRADRTPRQATDQALALLGTNKIAGIVLNGLRDEHRLYYQYRYSGEPRPQAED